MTALLNWRVWAGLIVALGLAFSHFTVYRSGKASVRAEWAVEKLAQSEAARQREKGMTIANAKNDKDIQNEKARDAALIRATGDQLRDLQSTLGAGVDSAPLGGADDPRDSIIDQCATALVGLDAEAKGLARQATGLQRYASNVCLMPSN